MAGSGEVRVPPRLASAAGPSTGGAPWSGSANGCALSHEELEFIAEEELVTVVPLFHAPRLQLLSGTVGAFRAQIPVQVPLWAAVALAAKAKAHILPPPWLDADALDETLSLERSSPSTFQPLPFHYLELSAALFKHAPEAFGDSTARVMDLVESIRSVRFNKIERVLKDLFGKPPNGRTEPPAVKLINLAAMEINVIRPFLLTAFNRFSHHASVEDATKGGALPAAAAAAAGGY